MAFDDRVERIALWIEVGLGRPKEIVAQPNELSSVHEAVGGVESAVSNEDASRPIRTGLIAANALVSRESRSFWRASNLA